MQSHRICTVLGVLLMSAPGCQINLEGDGDAETRSVESFSGVKNRSDADVELVPPGDGREPGDVIVTCSGGIYADVTTIVDANGVLIIDFAAEVASVFDCGITVVTEEVAQVITDGDGDIICEEPLTGVRTIEVNGNGSIKLATVEAAELNILVGGTGAVDIGAVTAEQLNIDLRGTGDATLAGEAARVDLVISGSGNLAARDLTAGYLHAALTGTGNAVITVNGIVDATVDGDSKLEVYGAAEAGDVLESNGGLVVFH